MSEPLELGDCVRLTKEWIDAMFERTGLDETSPFYANIRTVKGTLMGIDDTLNPVQYFVEWDDGDCGLFAPGELIKCPE